MPRERLGKDDCLPPGSINYDACHAKDAEEIARLTRQRDDAWADLVGHMQQWNDTYLALQAAEAEREAIQLFQVPPNVRKELWLWKTFARHPLIEVL